MIFFKCIFAPKKITVFAAHPDSQRHFSCTQFAAKPQSLSVKHPAPSGFARSLHCCDWPSSW